MTGLRWARDWDSPGPAVCGPATAKTWQGALDHVTCLNRQNYLGQGDWRLPNVNELESLYHAGASDELAWLEGQGFTGAGTFPVFWTSTSSAANSQSAWVVDASGYVEVQPKSAAFRVWPVRGEPEGSARPGRTGQDASLSTGDDGQLKKGIPWPMPRFEDQGDCLYDRFSGLLWMKVPDSTARPWAEALAYAGSVNLCGRSDWRLPNRKELRSLAHYGQADGAGWLNGQGVVGLPSGAYWSSTSEASDPTEAWSQDLWFGGSFPRPKAEANLALPVSGGLHERPALSVSPGAYRFGDVGTGSPAGRLFTLSNAGSGPLTVTGMVIFGGDSGLFSLSPGGAAPCPDPAFSPPPAGSALCRSPSRQPRPETGAPF